MRSSCVLHDLEWIGTSAIADYDVDFRLGVFEKWPLGTTEFELGIDLPKFAIVPVSTSDSNAFLANVSREVERIGKVIVKGEGNLSIELIERQEIDGVIVEPSLLLYTFLDTA